MSRPPTFFRDWRFVQQYRSRDGGLSLLSCTINAWSQLDAILQWCQRVDVQDLDGWQIEGIPLKVTLQPRD